MGGPMMVGGGGIGVLILALVVYLCGGDPSALLGGGDQPGQVQVPTSTANKSAAPDQNSNFARQVEGSLEDTWKQILPQQARVQFRPPVLVFFTGQTRSACGAASSATGPFYCPGDSKLYLDFAFFNELQQEFRAPGDFAQAYVIAHEFGHHIQNLMGTMDKVQRAGNNNKLSVALELQADCYAGVWGYYAQQKGQVEAGDPAEAIRAAQAVGDDTIQKRTQGVVMPDSFTHGSAAMRMEYFQKGFQSGDMRQCQTFR
jgi:predicted metalloprotease